MKNVFVAPALFCALVFFAVPHLHAQDQGSIKQAMSPEEFHKAGLDKLSDEELRNLDRWLRGDREKTAERASATIQFEPRPASAATTSNCGHDRSKSSQTECFMR